MLLICFVTDFHNIVASVACGQRCKNSKKAKNDEIFGGEEFNKLVEQKKTRVMMFVDVDHNQQFKMN